MSASLSSLKSSYIPVILAFLVGLIGGFLSASYISSQSSPITPAPQTSKEATVSPSFYSEQKASVQGKITALNGRTITVTNIQKQVGTILLSSKLRIYKPNQGNNAGNQAADLKQLEFNKDVIIELMMEDNQMKGFIIRYLPPMPTFIPKIVTTTPTPRVTPKP